MPTAFAQSLSSATAALTSTSVQLGQTALTIYLSSLTTLQVISVVVTVILAVAVILIIVKTGWFTVRRDKYRVILLKTDLSKKRVQDGWQIVEKHFYAGDDNDLKIAVIQADNILEEALKHAGVRGMNIGDRLKNIRRGEMPNLEDVWAAHKLRNQIAHETAIKLKRDTAERAIEAYKMALKNLGALE